MLLASVCVPNAADTFMRKQLVASDVQPTKHGNLFSSIDQDDDRSGESIVEVYLAACSQLGARHARIRRHIADIGKTFCAKQLVGDIYGRTADSGGEFGQSENSCFWRYLLGNGTGRPHKACDTGRRECGQEATPTLCRLHNVPPVP